MCLALLDARGGAPAQQLEAQLVGLGRLAVGHRHDVLRRNRLCEQAGVLHGEFRGSLRLRIELGERLGAVAVARKGLPEVEVARRAVGECRHLEGHELERRVVELLGLGERAVRLGRLSASLMHRRLLVAR